MPRRKVQFAAGNYYHIYNRGAARLQIFREADNYRYLLQLLGSVAEECKVTVVAFCHMPNHYHWLLRQDGEIHASKVPQRVFISYSQAYNRRYRRTGTLFESSSKTLHVDSAAYLRRLCLYIHANPVRNGLTSSLERWPHSSYHEWIGTRSSTLIDPGCLTRHFKTPERYKAALNAYIRENS